MKYPEKLARLIFRCFVEDVHPEWTEDEAELYYSGHNFRTAGSINEIMRETGWRGRAERRLSVAEIMEAVPFEIYKYVKDGLLSKTTADRVLLEIGHTQVLRHKLGLPLINDRNPPPL